MRRWECHSVIMCGCLLVWSRGVREGSSGEEVEGRGGRGGGGGGEREVERRGEERRGGGEVNHSLPVGSSDV